MDTEAKHIGLSMDTLTEAREAARALLEQLHLAAYLFEVEPRAELWEVRIDCALVDGWQSATIGVDIAQLLGSRADPALRARLLKEWRTRLAACKPA
ncbi:MAG: hypothetical protein A2637_05200 [Candidatus Muproteobacteria bacterium RIFCSPHIGHO2_01_FULL_65_16]|uniref:Uncharacterized protein n=1 Tax=Candidatus Muproteobacteria bacterium RIFCSPHIGHO2_01_FULL_65_16 TaxID=1817764 RepID=A0A1F6TP07_9PROT|nr:MAG: hypothetical protein A2637_05200 [Candidatus Muproteobacteria bacterium RIFCSPHIGHO2_01_FULL_65_16]